MKVAIIQICSKKDPEHNLKTLYRLGEQAKEVGFNHLFLPECFYSMSNGIDPTPYLVEKENEHYKKIQKLAKDLGVYLLGGSAATYTPDSHKIINRVYNFDDKGNELSTTIKSTFFLVS